MIGPIVVIVVGLLVGATGVLGRLGRLPRNRLLGVRTASTMRSDEAFLAGNRVVGPATALGGLAAVTGGVLALFLPHPETFVLAGVLAMAALAIYGGVRGVRAANNTDG